MPPVLMKNTPPETRLDLVRIREAPSKIASTFLHTPQYFCEPLSKAVGCDVMLKVETLNPIRSFKGRGMETVMAGLKLRQRSQNSITTVCASAGNLGQALAYSGRAGNMPVTVFIGSTASQLKVDHIKELGATVKIAGDDIESARLAAREFAEIEAAFLVEDSLDLDTCEGAATIGLELLAIPEPMDAVLIALGGGAMATGVGYVLKCLRPETQVITIQPAGAPAMTLSWKVREVVETPTIETIADGVAGRFPIPEVLQDLLAVADDALLVSEESIRAGMRLLYEKAGLVVEPSAALGIAALLENPTRFAGKKIATIICGSNVSAQDFRNWVIR